VAGLGREQHLATHAAITNTLAAGVPLRDAAQILAQHADPRITEHYDRARAATSTATAFTSSPPTSRACELLVAVRRSYASSSGWGPTFK
jgi:hypothetical protein